MKITAKVVPYSSVVGSSVTLHAESGMTICQLSLLSVIPPNFKFTPELHKQTSVRIAEWVASALNGAAEFDPASALENGPAGLADAKNDPADLSSLRKGAEVDFPMGAIENGRALADRLEMTGLECPAGELRMCSDWQEFRRCFEYLAEWALTRAALVSGSREEQS